MIHGAFQNAETKGPFVNNKANSEVAHPGLYLIRFVRGAC